MAGDIDALRQWLRRCPAVARGRLFGVDYLAEGEGYSLDAVASPIRYSENILGQVRPLDRQARDFVFAARSAREAGAERNLDSLEAMQAVADWVLARNAEGDFPRWTGGAVVGVAPVLCPCGRTLDADAGRYELRLRVTYTIIDKE